jgi:CheY-like chemotaxis protein
MVIIMCNSDLYKNYGSYIYFNINYILQLYRRLWEQMELKIMKNLLIVEDENIIARDYKIMIEHNGHHVIKIVNNGKDAIEAATASNPDFILMDINIKGKMNGIETAEELYRKQIKSKIIFITAYDVSTYVFPEFQHYFLNKPIIKNNLLNILNN